MRILFGEFIIDSEIKDSDSFGTSRIFRVLTLSDYKRVDDEDSHGGKIELEWWRMPVKKLHPEVEKLKLGGEFNKSGITNSKFERELLFKRSQGNHQ